MPKGTNICMQDREVRPHKKNEVVFIPVSFLLFLGPCHKRRAGGCCTQLGSLSALKHAVLGLYLLVFLILVGIFILAGKSNLSRSTPLGMREEDPEAPFPFSHCHKPKGCACCYGNHRGRCWLLFLTGRGSSVASSFCVG